MKLKNPTDIFIALSPGLTGLGLYGMALLDIALFKSGDISARQAIGHELLFFIFGLLATLFVIARIGFWLKDRKFKLFGLGIVSVLAFFWFFSLAGEQGAAILNAT